MHSEAFSQVMILPDPHQGRPAGVELDDWAWWKAANPPRGLY